MVKDWVICLGIWLLSSGFCLFNPQSGFGKKVIFCSWILGPCRFIFILLSFFGIPMVGSIPNLPLLGTVTAIVLALKFGESVMDRLNPNASRLKYIFIGFLSSVVFEFVINAVL